MIDTDIKKEHSEEIKITNSEFNFHLLNETGKRNALIIASYFDQILNCMKPLVQQGREFSIVKTKLEEACFFAKKSMASNPINHISVNKMEY